MSRINQRNLKDFGIDQEEWDALVKPLRQVHNRVGGLIVGSCVCGAIAYQPAPPACRALDRLVDLAKLVEL